MKYVIILSLLFCSIAFADSKQKATELLAEDVSIFVDPTQPIIDNAIERIRRQKIDEAKKYEPTDEEISAYIDMQIESKKKAKATPPFKSDMQIDSEKVNKEK